MVGRQATARHDKLGKADTLPGSDAVVGDPEPAGAVGQAQARESALPYTVAAGRLGRYVVLDQLGEGGMGVVLRAYDPELERPLAIKVLHRDLDPEHTKRLLREAKAMAKLSHPNVVQVYEVGEVEGRTFVAMELVKGQTVHRWMVEQPRPDWRACVDLFIQLGTGLAAAHERGLVHRDFKPGNAIIDGKGRARVLDFGLARLDSEVEASRDRVTEVLGVVSLESALTRSGAVMGTPGYMSPEQMDGRQADARSDQFSFCVALYEAVYGERPFDGSSLPELILAMVRGKVRPIPEGNEAPSSLRDALLRGLALEPDQRWPSMDELLEQLRKTVSGPVNQEIEHLRRQVNPLIGVRVRVLFSLVSGLFHLCCGLTAHALETMAGVTIGHTYLLAVSGVTLVLVIADAIRRYLPGSKLRPSGLMPAMQTSLSVMAGLWVCSAITMGLALDLPVAVTMAYIPLGFGLFVAILGPFLYRMLIPAALFLVCAVAMVLWPEARWLWWGGLVGTALMLMGWAWHGLLRDGRTTMLDDSLEAWRSETSWRTW